MTRYYGQGEWMVGVDDIWTGENMAEEAGFIVGADPGRPEVREYPPTKKVTDLPDGKVFFLITNAGGETEWSGETIVVEYTWRDRLLGFWDALWNGTKCIDRMVTHDRELRAEIRFSTGDHARIYRVR